MCKSDNFGSLLSLQLHVNDNEIEFSPKTIVASKKRCAFSVSGFQKFRNTTALLFFNVAQFSDAVHVRFMCVWVCVFQRWHSTTATGVPNCRPTCCRPRGTTSGRTRTSCWPVRARSTTPTGQVTGAPLLHQPTKSSLAHPQTPNHHSTQPPPITQVRDHRAEKQACRNYSEQNP